MMEEKQNGKTDFKRLKDLVMVCYYHERFKRNQQCNKIGQNALGSIISIVLEAVLIYSCVLIMFQMKKFGFKLMCIAAAVNAVVSVLIVILAGVVAGAAMGSASAGIAGGLVGAVLVVIVAAICPLITYFLMKPQWDVFE